MKDIFITATNTEIGKTYTTLKLLDEFSKMGLRVGAFKPIETGVDKVAQDATMLLDFCQKLNREFKDIDIDTVCPIQLSLPAAPFVANCGKNIDFNKIEKSYKKIKEVSDITLIEGAGGVLVPVTQNFYMVDFIDLFNLKPLLVTHSRLGSINDTLLSLEALKSRGAEPSWCVNMRELESNFYKITMPFYESKFDNILILQRDLKKIALELLES